MKAPMSCSEMLKPKLTITGLWTRLAHSIWHAAGMMEAARVDAIEHVRLQRPAATQAFVQGLTVASADS